MAFQILEAATREEQRTILNTIDGTHCMSNEREWTVARCDSVTIVRYTGPKDWEDALDRIMKRKRQQRRRR